MKNNEIEVRFLDHLSQLGEALCYGKDEDIIKLLRLPEYQALFFAWGQYIKKGAHFSVPFWAYCQALDPNMADGRLKEARKKGDFLYYKKIMAKKYQIGRRCGSVGSGVIYGYE